MLSFRNSTLKYAAFNILYAIKYLSFQQYIPIIQNTVTPPQWEYRALTQRHRKKRGGGTYDSCSQIVRMRVCRTFHFTRLYCGCYCQSYDYCRPLIDTSLSGIQPDGHKPKTYIKHILNYSESEYENLYESGSIHTGNISWSEDRGAGSRKGKF